MPYRKGPSRRVRHQAWRGAERGRRASRRAEVASRGVSVSALSRLAAEAHVALTLRGHDLAWTGTTGICRNCRGVARVTAEGADWSYGNDDVGLSCPGPVTW